MLRRELLIGILLNALTAYAGAAPPSDGIPHLEKSGALTHLVVDGKPFLILGGELRNSSASSLDFMKPIWPRMAAENLNTLLAPVSWELIEPKEDQFDFSLVDEMISAAQDNHLHLVFLWFGSWKNGESGYVPAWIRSDLKRFPRAQDRKGGNLEILSASSNADRDADAHAFAALMKHIRDIDGSKHTVLMMQVENESGVLGSPRDFSPEAEAAWKSPVPEALLDFLMKNKQSLQPELLGLWKAAGFRNSGSWAEVFGTSQRADEIFEAWQYSQYIDAVAAAGKTEYPIPMYVNAWLTQYEGEPGGEHPSGGAVSRVLDVWLAGISHIDFLAPDIYLPDLRGVLASYGHLGNPLFIPETRGGENAGANALYAFGQGAFGFSPFAIDGSNDNKPLTLAYDTLNQLAPLLIGAGRTQMSSVVRQAGDGQTAVELGGYLLRVKYQEGTHASGPLQQECPNVPPGAAIMISTAPDEFVIAGEGLTVTFLPDSDGPEHVELMNVEEGRFENGTWVPGRRLNGDETDGGNFAIFPCAAPSIQKVRVYRHD